MPRWINMRRHARALTRGDRITVSQGKWIVLRLMRIGHYSEYWNNDRQEAIGGPKWLYDDIVLRAISRPGSVQAALPGISQTAENVIGTAGIEDVSQMIYAIEITEDLVRYPMEGDRIYEITDFASRTKPIPPLTATSMYEVLNMIPDIGDHGRVEILYLHTIRRAGES